jgi:hydroxyquinol 1,2-dioxygenase
MDGPVGELVTRTGIDAPGHRHLITHLFRTEDEHLDRDAVFGVKEELVIPFAFREPGPTPDGATSESPWLLAEYDFVLEPM